VVRRIVDICLFLALSLVVWATPGFASSPAVQATDPNANSPAGVIYSIPLDSARQDASPHGHSNGTGATGGSTGSGGGGSVGGGGGSSGGGGSAGGSGATGGSGSSANSGSKGGGSANSRASSGKPIPVLVPGGQPGSLVHSANGFGSSSSVPGVDSPFSPGIGTVQNSGSSAPLVAIVLALVLLSLGGLAGARVWRGNRRAPSSPA
jgi:hypothetical protein